MTTGQEIADDVRTIFGDTLSVQITDPDLLRWINDAQLKMARTMENTTVVSTTAVIGNNEFLPLPAGFLKLWNASIGDAAASLNNLLELFITNLADVNAKDPYRYNSSNFGRPTSIYRTPTSFGFYPIPDLGYGLKLQYSKRPTVLTALADTIDATVFSDEFLPDLKQFVLARCYEADDQSAMADSREKKFMDQVLISRDDSKIADANTYPMVRDEDDGW
jgi:hypothetical protein